MIYWKGDRVPVIMKRFETHWCAIAVEAWWSGSNKYLEVLWWQASLGKYGLNEHLRYKG